MAPPMNAVFLWVYEKTSSQAPEAFLHVVRDGGDALLATSCAHAIVFRRIMV